MMFFSRGQIDKTKRFFYKNPKGVLKVWKGTAWAEKRHPDGCLLRST
jgi:hypothetical protein